MELIWGSQCEGRTVACGATRPGSIPGFPPTGDWCNGSTSDSESGSRGSKPLSPIRTYVVVVANDLAMVEAPDRTRIGARTFNNAQ